MTNNIPTYVNLTPHEVKIRGYYNDHGQSYYDYNNPPIIIPASGTEARIAEERRDGYSLVYNGDAAVAADGSLCGPHTGQCIPTTFASYGEITGLPDAQPGVILIVSAMVAKEARRPDVVSPGPAIRDESGRIIGCAGLTRWA
jgi:hypothetical protein